MKKTVNKNSNANPLVRHERRELPTLLEFLEGCRRELYLQFDLSWQIDATIRPGPVPEWAKRTFNRFGATVLKPLSKLRQPRDKVNFQTFGKTVGVIIRGITFFRHEAREMIAKDGLDKISAEEWEKIQPSGQTRAYLTKELGRPVAETENLQNLVTTLFDKRIREWEEMRERAFLLMAGRSTKENNLFLKGLQQGYSIFMDEEGQFCGDRGRTEIYMQLLSSMHEIEKMRRMIPPKKDADLYQHLKPLYRFPGRTDEEKISWLRNVCDDICLYMTGKRGRPHGT